jgi:glycosyltransferase involved in cell wall biosynthesis
MASLFDLEQKLKRKNSDNNIIYVFYKNTCDCDWAKEMSQNNKNIFFLTNQKIKGYYELKKILKNNNVNILHLHFNFPVIILFLLKIFSPEIKIIAHFHNTITGMPGMGFIHKLKIKVKKMLYNKLMDLFCGCGETVFDDLIKCGMNSDRCRYIDNGIAFSRLDITIEDGKEYYNLKNKKVIMMYGREYYRKGVDVAINAIIDIAAKYSIILMIVCQNKDFIQKQIKKQLGKIPEWILVVPSREDIAYYFKMSDIYLIPSREEGFPYAQLEAIYCGILTIRSNISQTDRKMPNDLVVPVNDIIALQQKIEYVLNMDYNTKQNILGKQKQYIVQRWNIDIWSEKIINMYLDILNK